MIARLGVIACLAIGASSYAAVPAPRIDLVKVDKSGRTLYLLSHDKIVAKFPIALGGQPTGHKQQEGDQRTPEGRYTLDFKKHDSSFFRAIHISYPNGSDTLHANDLGVSPGGAIMIHGQKNGFGQLSAITQKFDWTDGCIALTNEDMQRVWTLVQVPTPIEIVP